VVAAVASAAVAAIADLDRRDNLASINHL
jgi:hypothetical protein